jgi:hypothetical protein
MELTGPAPPLVLATSLLLPLLQQLRCRDPGLLAMGWQERGSRARSSRCGYSAAGKECIIIPSTPHDRTVPTIDAQLTGFAHSDAPSEPALQ